MAYNEIEKQIIEYLAELTDEEMIDIHNLTMELIRDDLNMIYYNEKSTINELWYDNPMEFGRSICYGDYNYMDHYFTFDGYGNIKSFNKYDLSEFISIDEIVYQLMGVDIDEYDKHLRDAVEKIMEGVPKNER